MGCSLSKACTKSKSQASTTNTNARYQELKPECSDPLPPKVFRFSDETQRKVIPYKKGEIRGEWSTPTDWAKEGRLLQCELYQLDCMVKFGQIDAARKFASMRGIDMLPDRVQSKCTASTFKAIFG